MNHFVLIQLNTSAHVNVASDDIDVKEGAVIFDAVLMLVSQFEIPLYRLLSIFRHIITRSFLIQPQLDVFHLYRFIKLAEPN